jgi:Mg-chelatase subunit ChlD
MLNLAEDLDFDPLPNEETLSPDPDRHTQLVASIRKHVRRLRAYLERLGRRQVEEYARRRGRRLDLGAVGRAVLTRSPNLLVQASEEMHPSAYVGVLIDRSGSMEGENIELAKGFGALVAESARGIRGIEGHVNAFDHDTFYRLGDFQRHAIEQLDGDGGNNDAGGLLRAAELALRSRKRHQLLIMISDGSPTGCSVDALRRLVATLTRDHGIVCVQAAVDEIDHDCFPRFVDLGELPMDEAVARFGKMLIEMTLGWR